MLSALPLWGVALLFVSASVMIWHAGTRLETAAGTISARTNLGQAFTGVLLLAAATSLPELATTVTAIVFLNNPTLAVHNLLGGVALQTAILVLADARTARQGALTYFSPRFVLMVQGVGLVLLLQIAVAGLMADGLPSIAGVSIWPVLIASTYAVVLLLTYRGEGHAAWRPLGPADSGTADDAKSADVDSGPMRVIWRRFAIFSLIVLAGGWLAAEAADVLADQTGLGHAFLGATLLAGATSLPEVSTTINAVRHERYPAAVSNIFGSNAFDVSLLLLADLLYRGGSIMRDAPDSVVFVGCLGAAMTCLYLWGLMERQNRTFLGLGWDSWGVLVAYSGGVTVLWFIS